MSTPEGKYQKRISEWRIVYLLRGGDVRVDSFSYESEAEAQEMLKIQIKAGAFNAGRVIQAKTFFGQ